MGIFSFFMKENKDEVYDIIPFEIDNNVFVYSPLNTKKLVYTLVDNMHRDTDVFELCGTSDACFENSIICNESNVNDVLKAVLEDCELLHVIYYIDSILRTHNYRLKESQFGIVYKLLDEMGLKETDLWLRRVEILISKLGTLNTRKIKEIIISMIDKGYLYKEATINQNKRDVYIFKDMNYLLSNEETYSLYKQIVRKCEKIGVLVFFVTSTELEQNEELLSDYKYKFVSDCSAKEERFLQVFTFTGRNNAYLSVGETVYEIDVKGV